MLTWILALCVLALVLTWFMRKLKLVRRTRTPGLGPLWVVKHVKTLPKSLHEWAIKNNVASGFAHLWLGPDLLVFAMDSESAQFVLKHPKIEKSDVYVIPSISAILGNGILTVDGEEFAHQRPLYKPAFNRDAYNSYFSAFSSDIEKFLTKVKVETKKSNTIDIAPWITKATMDILGHSVFNYDFGLLDNELEDEFHRAFQHILDTIANPWYRLFTFLDYLPLPPTIALHKNIDIVSQFCKKLVEAAKKNGTQESILTHMLADSGFSFQKLQANLLTLLIAGHETTATALTWAFMELGNHQDIQAKLYDEIQRNFPNSKPTSPADFDKLKYLDAFISEVLRLHSPVSVLCSRRAKEDIYYKNQVIPKGVSVGVHFAGVQTSPVFWKQPETFDPDRFLPPNKLQPRDHIPFSAGPRQCIGKEFSLIEQRLFLTRVLQEFQILSPESQPGEIPTKGGVLNSPESLFVKLQPRN